MKKVWKIFSRDMIVPQLMSLRWVVLSWVSPSVRPLPVCRGSILQPAEDPFIQTGNLQVACGRTVD